MPVIRKLSQNVWVSFLTRKIIVVAVSIFVLLLVTFALVQLIPGDPARVVAGTEASDALVEQVRTQLGLNLPLYEQLFQYIAHAFQGDLGKSFSTGEDVTTFLATRLPFTLTVALGAMGLTLLIAVPLGMVVAGATRGGKNRWLDTGFSWVTGIMKSLPEYVFAALLVVVFAIGLHWLPAAGATSSSSYVLPIIALSLGPICSISRVVRREVQRVLEQDYMRTVRGWRIGKVKQYLKYALPNILTSTLTLSGLVLTGLLGGAIIIENVFAWPGLGRGIVQAIFEKDYPVVQGIILTLGIIAICLYAIIDIVLALIDPRTLTSGQEH